MVIAQFLLRVIRLFGVSMCQIVKRQGIIYELDIREGIDFSIYLKGSFQGDIFNNLIHKLSSKPVIIDVGANIGSISLKLAKLFQNSQIYSFEPTYFAWNKLIRNLELNQELAKRIVPIQSFVGDKTSNDSDFVAFSSWPIESLKASDRRHKVHFGEQKEAMPIQTSIDDFVKLQKLPRVDLIKIDTDGYELNVLKGSLDTLRFHRPFIIFEFSDYLLSEKNLKAEDYFKLFAEHRYTLRDVKNNTTLTLENLHKYVPTQGTVDIMAIPVEKD